VTAVRKTRPPKKQGKEEQRIKQMQISVKKGRHQQQRGTEVAEWNKDVAVEDPLESCFDEEDKIPNMMRSGTRKRKGGRGL
jgi:hypothetical protein